MSSKYNVFINRGGNVMLIGQMDSIEAESFAGKFSKCDQKQSEIKTVKTDKYIITFVKTCEKGKND